MSTTTMHFGPEWMRAKQPHAAVRPHAIPSPPPTVQNTTSGGSPAPQGASSYSALLTPSVPPAQVERDTAHPFKYSRDEILRVWKEGGGRGPLPIEVELWEGVVREKAGEPTCLRDLTEAEKKLFTTGLNSELRRRQSTDFMVQGERGKLHHANSSHGGSLRDGLGIMGRRRRGDSTGADQPPLSLPRKTSWSANTGNLVSPSLPSPRTRVGNGSTGGSFDGVLNGSDSPWSSGKSRGLSAQPFLGRSKDHDAMKDSVDMEIKEEEESSESNADHSETLPSDTEPPQPSSVPAVRQEDTNGINSRIERLSIDPNVGEQQNNVPLTSNSGQNGMPWDESQFTGIQWSYIDPSGNIQGPFNGETMQSWHDQHYFTDDLMMKRTTIDADFFPLLDIKRRAQGERVFLCPLIDALPPPGLRQAGPPGLNTLLQRIDSPSQPSPQAYGRSATLDSYLAGMQASPGSSLSGGLARPSISPDPLAVGSRVPNARFPPDAPLSSRVSAGSYSSNGSPAMPQAMRNVFNDGFQPVRQSSFDSPQYNNNVHGNWQSPHVNGTGWSGIPEGALAVGDPFGVEIPLSNGQLPFMGGSQYNAPLGPAAGNVFPVLPEHGRLPYDQRDDAGFTQIVTPSRFAGAPQQLSMPTMTTGSGREFEQINSPVVASPSRMQPQPRHSLPVSPWGVAEPERPRPFDPDHPTVSNTYVASQANAPANVSWPRPEEAQLQSLHVPWLAEQQRKTGEAWEQPAEVAQGVQLTSEPLHIEQKETPSSESSSGLVAPEASAPAPTAPEPESAAPVQAKPASVAKKENADTPAPAPSKKKASAAQAIAPEAQPASASSKPAPSPSPSSQQKSVWGSSTTDDEKSKSAAPLGLREIQEAEKKKKQEARKAAEVERERTAKVVISSPSEEVQFTASWGLPTSRAGARSDNTVVAKDTTSSPSTTAAPVWTNAAKPAAKTMKEILEEEERRKLAKIPKEKEAAPWAGKRAAQSGPPKPALPTGGAWTTVGAGGKTNVIAAAVAVRSAPAAQTTAAPPASTASRVASTPIRQVVAAQTIKSITPKPEEASTPSPEFLKWMRDSLRGLNSSVQFEEIAQMLLSFPLDPDPSTVELISETVYGASTTLDGRRFASEFIAKRKTDAASRRGAPGLSDPSGRPTSLADVVKAQPKPAQNEFGGYKVVRKKNKGARS